MFVGIEVSRDRFDVHVRRSGESFAVARDGAGIAALAERLRAAAPAPIVLEATGGFEVAAGIAGAGLPLALVNRARVRAIARAVGRLAQTGQFDAGFIARCAEQVRPEARPAARPENPPEARPVAGKAPEPLQGLSPGGGRWSR